MQPGPWPPPCHEGREQGREEGNLPSRASSKIWICRKSTSLVFSLYHSIVRPSPAGLTLLQCALRPYDDDKFILTRLWGEQSFTYNSPSASCFPCLGWLSHGFSLFWPYLEPFKVRPIRCWFWMDFTVTSWGYSEWANMYKSMGPVSGIQWGINEIVATYYYHYYLCAKYMLLGWMDRQMDKWRGHRSLWLQQADIAMNYKSISPRIWSSRSPNWNWKLGFSTFLKLYLHSQFCSNLHWDTWGLV